MADQTTEQLTRNISKVVLYSFAIILNSWLLYVLWRDPMKRFRNSPSFIIANLALVDIVAAIGGLLSTSAIFVCNSNDQCYDTHIIFICIHAIGTQNSFVFITLLAVDRFLAISHPYTYKMLFESKRCHALLCIIGWSIGLTLMPMVYYLDLDAEKGHQFVLHQLYAIDLAVLAIISAALYSLNYINYLRKKRLLNASIHSVRAQEDLRVAQQLNVSSLIATIALFTCMAPNVIMFVFLWKECFKCLYDPTFMSFWVNYQVAVAVILFKNPIILAWRLPLYRRSSLQVAKELLSLIRFGNPFAARQVQNSESTETTTMRTGEMIELAIKTTTISRNNL